MMSQTLRFGICTDQNLPWPVLVERWQLFERLGFDSVWDCDHYIQPSRPTGPYFEAWTLLAGLAARTEQIRIGVLVSCNTFR
ncbi:MAG: LLM class flavin-dependent oxidoreductase, partial [Thermomicrobiales bacterium]